MRRALAASVVAAAAMVAVAIAQGRDRPAASTQAATGTARIVGIVVDANPQPQPVRKAIVALTGAEIPNGRTAITDDAGRFIFERLPAGRFTLTTSKPAYLPGSYGSPRPGRPGVPLQIAAGQQITDVRVVMPRGGVISGQLRFQTGEAASEVQVAVFRLPAGGANQTLIPVAVAPTDDRGVYRAYGLLPGKYYVASASRLSSSYSDIAVLPPGEVDRALRDLRQRNGFAPPASAPPSPPDQLSPGTYALPAWFYPGVTSPAAATTIEIGSGEEREGVDFIVQYTRMATIEGTIRHPDGTTPAVQMAINPPGVRLPALLGTTPTNSETRGSATGAFKYTNFAPGRYAISARTPSPPYFWAQVELDVTGEDVKGLSMLLQPPLRIAGRMVFESGSIAPPADLSTVKPELRASRNVGLAVAGYTRIGVFQPNAASVESNGRFEIDGILPDTYTLKATVPGQPGWWLRSATIDGRDLLDYPFEIGPASNITNLILTFSDQHTSLSGTLLKATGGAAPAYSIVVFPTDRGMWRPHARRIQTARTGTDGRWIMKDLPPGEYFVAAVTDVDPDEIGDASFLSALVPAAATVALKDGDQKTLDLRIGG